MVQILAHFYFILQVRCVKPFKTFPTIHENRVKTSGFTPFFFFPNMKFYELHIVAGQELHFNQLLNGFLLQSTNSMHTKGLWFNFTFFLP
jgi:hypothetical protein